MLGGIGYFGLERRDWEGTSFEFRWQKDDSRKEVWYVLSDTRGWKWELGSMRSKSQILNQMLEGGFNYAGYPEDPAGWWVAWHVFSLAYKPLQVFSLLRKFLWLLTQLFSSIPLLFLGYFSINLKNHFSWDICTKHLSPTPKSDIYTFYMLFGTSPMAPQVKNSPAVQETQEMHGQSLGWEDPLEVEMETHSSILAWKIPWTEEPGGRQSKGSQKSRTQLSNYACTHACAIYKVLYMIPSIFTTIITIIFITIVYYYCNYYIY